MTKPEPDKQVRAQIILHKTIVPALDKIGMGGRAAYELILGTGIQESMLTYRLQLGGPARGLWQMEPNTFQDTWELFIAKRPSLLKAMQALAEDTDPDVIALTTHDQFAAAMCRVYYYRIPYSLPKAGDIDAQAIYWKAHYNTYLGKGRISEYLKKWQQFVTKDTFVGVIDRPPIQGNP